MTRLVAVLGQEHEALQQRDSDALEKNTQEKQNLIAAIEKQGRERLELLKAAGIDTDRESVLSFVDAEPELRSRWDELESVLLECQKQNQLNGLLLEKGRQQTQQILGILLGEGSRKETELYNASGTTFSSFLNGRSVKV